MAAMTVGGARCNLSATSLEKHNFGDQLHRFHNGT